MSDVWAGCGVINRGAPVTTDFSELFAALLGCSNFPLYAYQYKDIHDLTDIAVNEGSEGSTFDAELIGAYNVGQTIFGPEGGTYPRLGDGTYQSVMKSGDEAFPNGYSTGMTWIIVYQPAQDSGESGVAGGGDMVSKNFTGDPDTLAEEMLYFGSLNFGGRTKRSLGFQTANWAYNDDQSIYTDLWYVFEIYFPPGDTDPVLYINGTLITGAHLTVTDNGTRVDHGAGYLVVGGDQTSAPDCAEGYYAMSAFYEGDIDSTCRSNYVATAISEGWIADPSAVEHLSVPATSSSGATSVGNFNETIMAVSGTCSFFSGAFTDGDTTSGSLGVGHSGAFEIWNGSSWIHIEPAAGPYTSPSILGVYIFVHDWGGGPAIIRMGDSLWSDNSGSFEVDIYPIAP